jgi:glycosyltransferase involved in cell wall biosynthesis
MANRLTNLEMTLRSLKSYPIEAIIVHDVQDADTGRQLVDLVRIIANDQVTLSEGTFGSPGKARNLGKSIARGRRIVFWDSDDVGHPAEIFEAVNQFPNSRVIIGNFVRVNSKDWSQQIVEFNPFENREIQLVENPGIWRFIFDAETIQNLVFEDFLMGEDQIFLLALGIEPDNFQYTNRIFYEYFVGNSYQLTENKISKVKLVSALHAVVKIMNKDSHPCSNYSHAMLAKMIISMYKNCTIQESISTTLKISRMNVENKGISLNLLLKYTLRIIIRKWKSK